ncbi:MAG TPA: porin [Bacteroidota bacterium]|nr:porin [Bacteroidota bacterium]
MALVCLTLSIGASTILTAQDSVKTSVSGFVDVYYNYCFLNRPPVLTDRSFTTQPLRQNEFNLNLGMIDVKYPGNTVRGRFALQTGTYVGSNYAAEPPLLKNVLEASVGTRLGPGVWVDLGIFPSHIGFEGIVSKDNWNYSRSLLADYSPYYESGLSVSASLSDWLSVRGLLLNGWQNIAETNSDKALGTQLQYTPSSSFLFNWSTFVGNEQPDSAASRVRVFNDFYSVISLSSNWNLAIVFDIGLQKNPIHDSYDAWHTASLMTQWKISDVWKAAGRLEYYFDRTGIIIPTGTLHNFQTVGASLNIDYAPSSILTWRLEARSLSSKDAIFPTVDGANSTHGFLVLSAAISL